MANEPTIAWHASHEQFAPEELLRLAVLAEHCGFRSVHSSDHFHPWSERQAHSGFSFAWLGEAWPSKPERNARLHECASIIRRLLDGEEVNHQGRVTVADAKLYSRPTSSVPIFAAALSPETAVEVASWADGLLTLWSPELRSILDVFRTHGGATKPIHVKVDVCYGRNEAAAQLDAWQQWRTNVLDREQLANVRTTAEFEVLARNVTPEQVAEKIIITADPARFREVLVELASLDVTTAVFHHVGSDQETFIRECAPVLCYDNLL